MLHRGILTKWGLFPQLVQPLGNDFSAPSTIAIGAKGAAIYASRIAPLSAKKSNVQHQRVLSQEIHGKLAQRRPDQPAWSTFHTYR